MATATHKYTAAKGAQLPVNITKVTDTTNLGAGVDVALFVAKDQMTKLQLLAVIEALEAELVVDTHP